MHISIIWMRTIYDENEQNCILIIIDLEHVSHYFMVYLLGQKFLFRSDVNYFRSAVNLFRSDVYQYTSNVNSNTTLSFFPLNL